MKKPVWLVVAVTFVLLIAIAGIIRWQSSPPAVGENDVIAIVGDEKIDADEWLSELKDEYGDTVLQKMIDRILVEKEAERLGIKITDDELNLELAHIRQDYGMEPDMSGNPADIPVERLKKELRYTMLLEELAMKDVHITDAEIAQYYEQNQEYYTEPEQVYLHQIIVETRDDAEQVIREFKDGTGFASLAAEWSIDVLYAGNGGEVGWITKEDIYIDPAILETAFEMEKDEISDPIPVDQGYAVIRITDHKDAYVKPLEEVKRDIKRELGLFEAQPIPQILEELRQKAGVEILINPKNDDSEAGEG